MTKKPQEGFIPLSSLLPIVGDAALANDQVEGFLVPLLIVDTSNHPEIDEIIRIHKHLPFWYFTYQWGERKGNPDVVALILDFQRPIEAHVVLLFSIEKQAVLVVGDIDRAGHVPTDGKAR